MSIRVLVEWILAIEMVLFQFSRSQYPLLLWYLYINVHPLLHVKAKCNYMCMSPIFYSICTAEFILTDLVLIS